MFFLFILLILIILGTIKVKLEIKSLNISIKEPNKKDISSKETNIIMQILKLEDNYLIILKVLILTNIPIFKINLNKKRIDKIRRKIDINKINSKFKSIGKDIKLSEIKKINNKLNIKIYRLYLKISVGLDSIMVLVYTVPIICTIISNFFAKQENFEKNFYKVEPMYNLREFSKY